MRWLVGRRSLAVPGSSDKAGLSETGGCPGEEQQQGRWAVIGAMSAYREGGWRIPQRPFRDGNARGEASPREERRIGKSVAEKWFESDIRKVKTMNIGEFKNVNGRLMGSIATRTIDLPRIGLRPVESQNVKAPVFEVVALNVGRRWVQIGALWEAASNATGEVFLQGSLDDPSLPEALPIALFGSDEEGYRVAWRRQQMRDDFGPAVRGQRRDYAGGEGGSGGSGGFGESTAGADGGLSGDVSREGLDEEIPF